MIADVVPANSRTHLLECQGWLEEKESVGKASAVAVPRGLEPCLIKCSLLLICAAVGFSLQAAVKGG